MIYPAAILLMLVTERPIAFYGNFIVIDQLSVWVAAVGLVIPVLFSVLIRQLSRHGRSFVDPEVEALISEIKLKYAKQQIVKNKDGQIKR